MSKEKVVRNKALYRKWKRSKKGYKRLALEYGLNYRTVGRIIKRYEESEGVRK